MALQILSKSYHGEKILKSMSSESPISPPWKSSPSPPEVPLFETSFPSLIF